MKKQLIVAVAASIMATGTVFAADLPPYRDGQNKGIAYLPVFTWTGFYVGAHAGYGFAGDKNVDSVGQLGPNIANIATGARPGSVNLDRNGFIGGGQVGYNDQWGQIVYGLEADISYTDLSEQRDFVTGQINTGLAQSNFFQSELEYLGTVRARLGYAFDRTLVYATAGFAYGDTKHRVDMLAPSGITQFAGQKDGVRVGYTVGAGIEYAITDKISFKTEYLYYDLGEEKAFIAAIPGTGVTGGYTSNFKNDGHIIRAGLNWKFH